MESPNSHPAAVAARTSAIDTLPPELLAGIFDYNTTHDSFYPVVLSHVSALWRRTATTTPKLWRDISVRIPSPVGRITADRARAWLERAAAFPVRISLSVTEESKDLDLHPVFEVLRQHSWHCSHLAITASTYRIARQMFISFSFVSCGMLSRIDLKAGLSSDDTFLDAFEPHEIDVRGEITTIFYALNDISAQASCFMELNLSSAALPFPSRSIMGRPRLSHLRTLRIFDQGREFGQIDASSVLRVLADCPALETFSFRGAYLFETHSDVVDIIHLPQLREMHLAQTFHQRIILSRLCTPRLEVLRLSWLNRPDMFIEDEYDSEFSDEREEPVEYSQSPHTDVLTGIGLRALIRRSSPPLRVLDMDFADARSPKDFLWLFTHLPSLEMFRIVGSDMSDKVLCALASPYVRGTWLCPRLTHVELMRCDMITGLGVISFAKGRNQQINDGSTEYDGIRPARLVKFQVNACASVDCESVAVMQYVMGDVDFEVEKVPSELIFPEEGIEMPE